MILITDKEIYSDAGKLIHRVGSNVYFKRCIKLEDDIETNFEEVSSIPQNDDEEKHLSFNDQVKIVLKAQTRAMTSFTNNEALDIRDLFDNWIDYTDENAGNLKAGQVVRTADGLWRVRQEHKAQKQYPPSIYTSSLYERIVREHAGTVDDPIPYSPPMEIFNGKYYKEDNVTYLCNRDSQIALSHNLKDLVGLYVEVVETEENNMEEEVQL